MTQSEAHQMTPSTAAVTQPMMDTAPNTIAAIDNPLPLSPERLICSWANQPRGSAMGEAKTPNANANTAVMLRRREGVDSVTSSLYRPAPLASVPTPKLGWT